MKTRKMLGQIMNLLVSIDMPGVDKMELATDILEIVIENSDYGQINQASGNSTVNAVQNNKYKITGGNIKMIGDNVKL